MPARGSSREEVLGFAGRKRWVALTASSAMVACFSATPVYGAPADPNFTGSGATGGTPAAGGGGNTTATGGGSGSAGLGGQAAAGEGGLGGEGGEGGR